jgi:hypothetical protein
MRGAWRFAVVVVLLLAAATTVMAQPETNCGGELVNVLESVEHCGSCFFKCQVPENTGGTMKCTNGECDMKTVDLYLLNQQAFPEA